MRKHLYAPPYTCYPNNRAYNCKLLPSCEVPPILESKKAFLSAERRKKTISSRTANNSFEINFELTERYYEEKEHENNFSVVGIDIPSVKYLCLFPFIVYLYIS